MAETAYQRFGIWPGIFVILISGGALASLVAVWRGASPAQLNSFAPFGFCAGLNIFCAMAVATGSLIVLGAASILEVAAWRSVRRPALILALSAYTATMLAMLSGISLPHRAWPAVVQLWNPSSVMYGALWTLLLLVALVLLEFLGERIKRKSGNGFLQRLQTVLVVAVLVASLVQQLGLSHTVTADSRASWLWTSPDLAVMFVLSSACAGLALLLFAIWRASLAFGVRVPVELASQIARVLSVVVFLYFVLRIASILQNAAPGVSIAAKDSGLLVLELLAFVIGMMWLGGGESKPQRIQLGALMVVAGVMLNRLNTCITALEGSAGPYRPSWIEVLITFSLIAIGIAEFAVCAKHLPLFAHGNVTHR